MSDHSASNPTTERPRKIWIWAAVFTVLLILFTWVYNFEPITNLSFQNSDYLNDKTTDVLTLIPALAVAIFGALLTRHFKPSEPPYRIWLTFTLGWWSWVGGELLGFVYDYYYWVEYYPEFTFIDLCWVLGYIFFGLSLYYQFRLIYSRGEGAKTAIYLAFISIGLLLTSGLTQLALAAGLGGDASWLAVYVAVLYPVFDLFEGAAALWLFFLFGRGYLGRPWWGLIAFAIADSINIYSWIGGFGNTPEDTYLKFDLFSNVVYVAGYMITALAFLSIIEHIEHGITAPRRRLPPDILPDPEN